MDAIPEWARNAQICAERGPGITISMKPNEMAWCRAYSATRISHIKKTKQDHYFKHHHNKNMTFEQMHLNSVIAEYVVTDLLQSPMQPPKTFSGDGGIDTWITTAQGKATIDIKNNNWEFGSNYHYWRTRDALKADYAVYVLTPGSDPEHPIIYGYNTKAFFQEHMEHLKAVNGYGVVASEETHLPFESLNDLRV